MKQRGRKNKEEMHEVRVKRKGQVTTPLELRSKLGMGEGALPEVKGEESVIVPKSAQRLRAGKVVGEGQYKEIISELDQLRRDWH